MSDPDKEFLLVTEYFHPDTASTGQLMTDLAVGLRERGLDLRVLTSQPNYHSGDNEKQPRSTVHEGVPVDRIRAPQLRQSSLLRRLFNWGLFTVWMFGVLLVSQTEKEREIVFVSNPPFLPIAMWLVCRIRGWNYTYIVHDLYPDQPVELEYIEEGGAMDKIWRVLNRRAFLAAKHIVALGPVMKERISRNAGPKFDESKVEIIHNWEDEEFIQPMEKEDNWFSEEHGLEFDLVSDMGRNAIDAYGLEIDIEDLGLLGVANRSVFIVDNDGEVTYTWVADDPTNEPDYEELLDAVQSA